jgi:hypothetical protein
MMKKHLLPDSYYNHLSLAGTAIATIALFMFVFLYVLASSAGLPKAYEGIVIFMVIPAFIVLGLLLIPLGMFRAVRRARRTASVAARPGVLDLNKPANRRALVIFVAGTIVFLFLSALGSYKAYNFTDSIRFCGTLCHTVMKPEYTTYLVSPHARVACAECHVGPGASWYVKSKMSGLYQVYAVISNSYPRPIPVPIRDLRPARETCEQCHWPQKVYGKQQRLEIHYLPDEANTRWTIELLLNTGAGNQALGFATGIHWHINKDVRIEYVPADEKRETIARVILTELGTGQTTVFDSPAAKAGGPDLEKYPSRFMDCIDCHNCPSHGYKDPLAFVNAAFVERRIDPSLPFIKKVAVEACLKTYPTTEAAREGIAGAVRAFYAERYPDVARSRADLIGKAAAATVDAYLGNVFPEMKARWTDYPNHIGHLSSPGCFRCHDGQHASSTGRVIGNDCALCHAIYGQGAPGHMIYGAGDASLPFKHPVDIEEAWKSMACSDCHSSPPIDY